MDPITIELIKNALVYASEEMGIAVRNSAYSPNIKERLDHSCALFDKHGQLIAQAEHIPVHLGSLPWGLQKMLGVIEQNYGKMQQGQMWVANDPYITGTHLNDVTLVRPIFFKNTLIGYAANKAHHTDVGGMVPGSISIEAKDLFAEGLIVPGLLLMDQDEIVTSTLALFSANSRTPAARAGDLRAQIAGNYIGERRLLELYQRYGTACMEKALESILDDSEQLLRAALEKFPNGTFESVDYLEDPDGEPSICIALKLSINNGRVSLDYTGTSKAVPYALNAVLGVTLSGVHYVLRAVTDPSIPMNAGCFRVVDVHVPAGTLLNPNRPAAVSGGNVETSTRNADVILQAFAKALPGEIPACSGGTMSNVLLGGTRPNGETWAFYETNGCGMGARPTANGLSGIQCHMTNTLNTPIEVIERDYPLRIVRYEFADDTGGNGHFRGGDGLIRAFELTEPLAYASLLADRHHLPPQGLDGGEPGLCGQHSLTRNNKTKPLPAKTSIQLQCGDILTIQTPGGGGYGRYKK